MNYQWNETSAREIKMSNKRFDTYDNPAVLEYILCKMKERDLVPSFILYKEMNENGIVFSCVVGYEHIQLPSPHGYDSIKQNIKRLIIVPLNICTTI